MNVHDWDLNILRIHFLIIIKVPCLYALWEVYLLFSFSNHPSSELYVTCLLLLLMLSAKRVNCNSLAFCFQNLITYTTYDLFGSCVTFNNFEKNSRLRLRCSAFTISLSLFICNIFIAEISNEWVKPLSY